MRQMKIASFYFVLFVFASGIYSCSDPGGKESVGNRSRQYVEIEKLRWLKGVWENSAPEGRAVEFWEIKNDSVLIGKSCFIIGGDTVSSENLSLEQHGIDVFYIPVVKNQNNGLPVKFRLMNSKELEWIFENPDHDFPQKITYRRFSVDSLLAVVSGTEKGEFKEFKFLMSRIK